MCAYSAIRKNEFSTFAETWMALEEIMLSKISQIEKEKYHMISLMWNLGNRTDEQMGRGKKREGGGLFYGCKRDS